MKLGFDMWISFKIRLLALHSVVQSWSVCIPGGQEPGSVPRVALDALEGWCALRGIQL